jgi:diguanylate cyclase (GGDEF)-like protein
VKILVADDDAVSRKIMQRMLQQTEYEVTTADNGLEAAQILLKGDGPRLALLDWMMPELNGPQVCRRVREAQDHRYVYLTLLTSRDSNEDLIAGLEAGADDYLIKPCNPAELKARLRTGQRILRLEDTLVAAREDMRFRATHDALTGLWNRASVLEFLRGALDNAESTAVLLCDIDHFKHVNDTHGHLVGDAVLREVAGRLRAAVRTGDGVGRFGGEEFLIVLRKCEMNDVRERAEGVRRAISEREFVTGDSRLALSISIGCTASRGGNIPYPVESILSRADTSLYQAKEAGRNRVMFANLAVVNE